MNTYNKQLIVFAKLPQVGKCKTRLIPFLSAEQACEFYKHLVSNCFKKINALSNTDIRLYTYPDTEHPFIESLMRTNSATLHQQQGNDLGERMHHAIQSSLQTHKKCVLIGTDCPTLDAAYITQAFNALEHHDMVLGPAIDGGYVLIGATKIEANLFNNINWGTDTVFQQSLKNNTAAGYRTYILNSLRDIDTPNDYLHYQQVIEPQLT